jgi:hypothetical protein
MATTFCPHCHQPMPGKIVHGVRLPQLKTELFDYIDRHPGMSGSELAARFGVEKISSHIWQINDALMDTGVQIRGGVLTRVPHHAQ